MAAKYPKMLPDDPEVHTLLYDLKSDDYHAHKDSYSSSQWKDALEDEEIFINKYIKKTVEREDIPAFSVGNYFHTGVLEPHKLKTDCIVFEGKVRRGAAWDKFKEKHSKKVIISPTQLEQAQGLIAAVKDSPVAMGYIKKGTPEVSFFAELYVIGGEIYSQYYGKRMTRNGWVKDVQKKSFFSGATKILVKVRADSFGEDFILDLKSTTGNARSVSDMQTKIKYYNYDLSAAFYLDIFSLPEDTNRDLFIWTFASKDRYNCKSYRATPRNIQVGRVKWMRGVLSVVESMKNEWQVFDSLGELDAHYSDLHYIAESDMDYL